MGIYYDYDEDTGEEGSPKMHYPYGAGKGEQKRIRDNATNSMRSVKIPKHA
jgi:hypothetical protein